MAGAEGVTNSIYGCEVRASTRVTGSSRVTDRQECLTREQSWAHVGAATGGRSRVSGPRNLEGAVKMVPEREGGIVRAGLQAARPGVRKSIGRAT